MKACFFGLGSIGQRHLKNLKTISKKFNLQVECHALRSSDSPLPPDIESLISKTVYTEKELDKKYDIIFITNPTSLHYDTLKNNCHRAKAFFIEKPIFEKARTLDEKQFSEGIFYVACPLRYTKVFKTLQQEVSKNMIFAGRAICSSYLPHWRKGTDYIQTYSARKELGGGVKMDLIHELDYITNLFGFPQSVILADGKFSDLKINSEDYAAYILKYNNKIITLHLDYFGMTSKREIELFTDSGTIIGDFINSGEQPNDKYLAEMEYFLDCVIKKQKTWNELVHANRVLFLAEGVIVR